MTAFDHPEFEAEYDHLRDVLAVLEERIAEVGAMELWGPTPDDTAALHRAMVQIHQNLKSARQQVYFGRLDFAPDQPAEGDPPVEAHYLGRVGFDRNGRLIVVDWRAPIGRLFSRRRPGSTRYASPDGEITGDLRLKRHLRIQDADLQGVYDEFDTRPDAPIPTPRAAWVDPDAFLREVLSGRRDALLGDIVATIQEHQDDLIRADPGQALVVQGAAGSGKTSIALHRVAYLLYPGNKTGIEARRCIVFGPNRLYLDYIANVLPGLGVADIPQTTLEAWALERLGLAGRPVTDSVQQALLAPRTSERQRALLARRSALKGSLRWGRVLERYADWWRAQFKAPEGGVTYRNLGPLKVTVSLPQERVAQLYRSITRLPVMEHRRRLAELVLGELMGEYASVTLRQIDDLEAEGKQMLERQRALAADATRLDELAAYARAQTDLDLEESGAAAALAQGAAGLRALAEHFGRQGERAVLRAARLREAENRAANREPVRDTVQRALAADLDRWWPPLEPLAAYRALLAQPDLLQRLAHGLLPADELALIQPLPEGDALNVSDLPSLCYLHLLAYGVPVPVYDHVVVDEAQDVAPLYYAVLRRLSRNGSFTLLGDLAQGVYAYRGLSSWDELAEVFAGAPYAFHDVRDSYRSTYEIITFANRVLEALTPPGAVARLATPFERHGPPVRLVRLAPADDMVQALAVAVSQYEAEGFRNIAVLAKTPERAAELAAGLRGLGAAPTLLDADSGGYAGGLAVLPVHLSKGMEFEVVLVADAGSDSYGDSEFDGRLLYVAITRALHALALFAAGTPNVFLELAEGE